MNFKMPVTAKDFIASEDASIKKKKSKEKENLEKELEKIKNQKVESVDDVVKKEYNIKFLDKNQTTDDEIEKQAQKKMDNFKNEKVSEITDSANSAINNKKNLMEDEKVKSAEDVAKIESAYQKAKDNWSDDAIKRGIQRSSIVADVLKDYDIDKINMQKEREVQAENNILKLEEDIDNLNKKLKTALSDLDMKTAFELNENIEKLKKERDAENEKVVKYNNEMNEKLAKYRDAFLKTERGKAYSNSEKELNLKKYRDMTNLILNYYDSLSYDDVVKDFNESNYGDFLNDNNMKLIKTYIKRRSFE